MLRMQAPSAFEAAVLRWIGVHSGDPALKAQLATASIREREHQGVGCYSTLDVPPSAQATTQPYADHGPLSGPGFDASGLEHGGDTLLWFEAGRAVSLEISTYAEDFPQDHGDLGDFKLFPPPPESKA